MGVLSHYIYMESLCGTGLLTFVQTTNKMRGMKAERNECVCDDVNRKFVERNSLRQKFVVMLYPVVPAISRGQYENLKKCEMRPDQY